MRHGDEFFQVVTGRGGKWIWLLCSGLIPGAELHVQEDVEIFDTCLAIDYSNPTEKSMYPSVSLMLKDCRFDVEWIQMTTFKVY